MEKQHRQKELQLLPPHPQPSSTTTTTTSSSSSFSSSSYAIQLIPMQTDMSIATTAIHRPTSFNAPSAPSDPTASSLELQLSVNCLRPIGAITKPNNNRSCIRDLKCQAAKHIRLAALEKKYAERVRELTRREMELAQAEFAKARAMWETAKKEMAKAEMLKESATDNIQDHSSSSSSSSSSCLEFTCQSCSQRFRDSNA